MVHYMYPGHQIQLCTLTLICWGRIGDFLGVFVLHPPLLDKRMVQEHKDLMNLAT